MFIVVALVGLSLLIVLHEGGHYLVAKWCGMRVERFSIGFGPTLIGFKRGETTFQIAPILLGGFVQITGLNPHEEFDASDPRVYPNRPAWMRLATLVGGPGANYLTAVVLVFFLVLIYGTPTPPDKMRVEEAMKGRPAAQAGLQAGDVLVSANGQAVTPEAPINNVIRASQGRPVTVKVDRGGKIVTVAVAPEKIPSGDYQIGVRVAPLIIREEAGVGQAAIEALKYPVLASAGIVVGIKQMISGKTQAEVGGPVEITRQMAKAASRGALPFLELIAMLSVYLGLINLVPLPALDGGRAAFLMVGSLFRRKINPFVEAQVHSIGFVLLLGLMLIVTFKDIFLRS